MYVLIIIKYVALKDAFIYFILLTNKIRHGYCLKRLYRLKHEYFVLIKIIITTNLFLTLADGMYYKKTRRHVYN